MQRNPRKVRGIVEKPAFTGIHMSIHDRPDRADGVAAFGDQLPQSSGEPTWPG